MPTIVFVNYCSSELIAPRAESLGRAGYEVIVADNSGDYEGPAAAVRSTGGNVGFGAACNVAMAGSLGRRCGVAQS
ncbi:MAG: hypothetical protein U5K30_00590 [Acidimicrobiales bacterium]|nr:hypothetical protein [Acidimicrobiales bacterium]